MSDHEFPDALQDFMGTNFEHDPKLTNLADLVAWNQAHAEVAMPERRDTDTCPHPRYSTLRPSTDNFSA